MARQRTTSGKARSVLAIALLAAGVMALVPKFIAVTPFLSGTLLEMASQMFNALPGAGLDALHAGQTLAFDPPGFLAAALRILISFWPLLLVGIGTVLMRKDSGIRLGNAKSIQGSSKEGDVDA